MSGPRSARRRTTVAIAVLAFGLLSCAAVVGIDSLEIGECKGGGDCASNDGSTIDGDAPETEGGEDSGIDVLEGPCPGDAGPIAVHVGGPENRFCIDTTEVTVKQYAAFLAAADAGKVGPQPTACAWNTTYQPTFLGADEI